MMAKATAMEKLEDRLAGMIGNLAELMTAQTERIDALESTPEPVQASAVTPVKRTRVPAQDAELARLRLAVPKESKAVFIEKCAEHSYEALETLILAGSREARAFMAGEAQAAAGPGEYALVVDHPNGRFACAMLERHENLPVTAHSARAKRGPTADMNDTQLLTFRPANASKRAPARKAWLMRTRAKLG